MATIYGTANQHHYMSILRTQLTGPVVEEATRKVLGLDATAPLPETVTVENTSSIINLLKEASGKSAGKPAAGHAGSPISTVRKMSGRELLALANLDAQVPVDLDPDLLKVVMRLRRMTVLAQMTRGLDKPIALNGVEPIRVDLLVELLGSPADAAKALGVTIKTLEGWGEYLPDSHESRAELVTRGAVKARLPA